MRINHFFILLFILFGSFLHFEVYYIVSQNRRFCNYFFISPGSVLVQGPEQDHDVQIGDLCVGEKGGGEVGVVVGESASDGGDERPQSVQVSVAVQIRHVVDFGGEDDVEHIGGLKVEDALTFEELLVVRLSDVYLRQRPHGLGDPARHLGIADGLGSVDRAHGPG